jgi:hypothetical protein
LNKFYDDYYCKQVELLISQLRKIYFHPERYPYPEQLEIHRYFLKNQFSKVSFREMILSKNIEFRYKWRALTIILGLYHLAKLFHKTNGKKYEVHSFPELSRQEILNFYSNLTTEATIDEEKKLVLNFLKERPDLLSIEIIFPHIFVDKYKDFKPSIFKDKSGLYYVEHFDKKMFFPRGMKSKSILECYNRLCLEQDIDSPHCYTNESFNVAEGDVCLDIGCAEGNFSLTHIEKIKKLYLFEVDPNWNEALNMTFAPWKSKVQIINKFISDKNDDRNISLDTFIKENNIDVTFIKIDAEGAEESILKGSTQLLKKNNLKIAACTYHCSGDARLFFDIFSKAGFKCNFSNGYMVCSYDGEFLPPYLRRGLIRATKD